jgi:Fe2+ transport system protein B
MPNGMDEKRVREIVEAEVAKQNRPILDWMHGFWSNGSGKPLGFFQMRILQDDERFRTRVKADDERYQRLEQETKSQSETLETLKDFMFEQKLSREAREKAEKKAEEERKESEQKKKERIARYWSIAKWAAPVIGSIIVTLAAWIYSAAAPVLKILWEDYLKAHPIVSEQLKQKHLSLDSDPSVAKGTELGGAVPHY